MIKVKTVSFDFLIFTNLKKRIECYRSQLIPAIFIDSFRERIFYTNTFSSNNHIGDSEQTGGQR